jgi:hypothetical protein
MTRAFSANRSLLAVAMVVLLALAAAQPSFAIQSDSSDASTPTAEEASPDVGPRFLIHPADGVDGDYFTLEAEPGTDNDLTVVIGNSDDEPLTLRSYVNDVVPVTNGGFAMALEDVEPTGTATWIDYQADTFELEPGEGVERTFTVSIPDDAEAGEHIAGLALETVDPVAVEGTQLLEQVIRKTIAVFIIVPGDEEASFSLGEPEYSSEGALDTVNVPLENTGNVLVRPAGEMTVTDADGKVMVTAPIAMNSVYAGTTVTLSVPVGVPLEAGDYTVSVELEDAENGAIDALDEATVSVTAGDETAAQFIVTATVTLQPDADDPAYADVSVTVTNDGQPIPTAEVLLDVILDGEPLETFPLAAAVPLPQGDSVVSQRYIPPSGWESGTWSFVVRVNVIDPATTASTNVATIDDIPAIEVGK